MTVASNTPYDQYTATGGQTVFNYTFEIVEDTDLLVYQTPAGDPPDDLTTLLTLNVDYTVTGVGNENGGTVILNTGATLNDIVTIMQDVPVQRDTSFTPGGILRAQDLNSEFDNQTLIQQLSRFLEGFRMLKYQNSAIVTPLVDTIIPVLGANQTWVKNQNNDGITVYDLPIGGGLAPNDATYILQTPNVELPNAQAMSLLSTGFVMSTTGTGAQLTRVFEGTANQIGINNPNGFNGNPEFFIEDNPVMPGTAGMGIPSGTTAERVIPTPPSIGLRFNTDLGIIEAYIGGNWVEIPSSAAGLFLPLAGGTMSGDIDMDGNLIHNLDTPVSAGDATNKDYVDTLIGSSAGGNNGAMQYNNSGAFGGDDNFTTDGSGNVDITGSLDVDNISLNGNRLSASTGLLELEDSQLFNDMDADSNKVINLLDPTAPQDAATKAYVDAVAQGLYFLEPARVASTANFVSTYNNGASGVGATLTANSNGAASIDGVSLSLNDRVLFKNQTNTFENGIYTVTQVGDGSTPAIYTRANDYDEPSDIDPGDFIVILAGTTNTGTGWVETATVTTIGTDAITFVAFTNANYVTINTNQTITGQKTFSGNVALSAGATLDLNASTAVDEVIDDDTFATATATNLATAESIKAYVDAAVAASTGNVPTGAIFYFPVAANPTGYLACNGAAVSRTTYAALFALIGTGYGAGDGSTTFNLPNISRRVAMGEGGTGTGIIANTVGALGGSETINILYTNLPTSIPAGNGFITTQSVASGVNTLCPGGAGTWTTGAAVATSIVQSAIILRPLIKT